MPSCAIREAIGGKQPLRKFTVLACYGARCALSVHVAASSELLLLLLMMKSRCALPENVPTSVRPSVLQADF